MITDYLRIYWRSIWRSKGYSFINVGGLAVGISACMLTFIFIRYERSFDRFQPVSVYRLCATKQQEVTFAPQKIARTMFPMGPTLKADFPEVKDFTRIISLERVPLQRPGEKSVMGIWFGTDASFLRMFNFKMVKGNASTALESPNSIVLTQKLAWQLFGSEDPLGQTVIHKWRDTIDYTVTGVLEDIPHQSHLQFDALHSISASLLAEESTNWENDWVSTYLQLQENTDIEELEAKLPAYVQKYMGKEKDGEYQLFLQPIRDIHLWSGSLAQDLLNNHKFNGSYLYLLAAVSLFVLVLAIMNYINLTTAQSTTRAREIGIRKTSGASRVQVACQFLGDAMMFSLIATMIAFLLVYLLLPVIHEFSGRHLRFNILAEPFLFMTGAGVAIGTGFMSGLIPAWLLSNIKPVTALTEHLWTRVRSPLRNALVIIQFTVAIGLSVSTLSAFRQLKFMQRYDPGFNKEEVLVAQVSWTARTRVESLMDNLRQIPGVRGVTGSLRRLGDPIDQNEVVFQDADRLYKLRINTMFVDYNYVPFYQIELLAGRNLSPEFGNDRQGNSYLINEGLARKLLLNTNNPGAPFSSLIGRSFRYSFQDSTGTIVGIIRDFNFNSLHHPVEPLCVTYMHDYYFKELSVRIDGSRRAELLSHIERSWENKLPDQDFNYYFLDDYIERLYKTDTQTGVFIGVLTMLAIFISCLGLLGLVVFSIERRIKEIGIRKVNGARIFEILVILNKEFVKWVLIAFVIACPIAYYAMNKWLEGFAYKTTLSWWIFALAGLLALGIALLTVSWQSWKAATRNPVEALRYE
ncbi:MAG: ABC transporter permease [Prolixibacteraceae bacterium]